MLALSNGVLNVLPPEAGTPDSGPGDILLGVSAADGVAGETRLYSEGSLVAATDKRFVLDGSVRYGTRNLTLAAGGFNVGEQALLAELAERGVLPTGLALDQQVLDRLLQGDASEGAPPLETLVLNARDAFNFYGDVSLDSYDPSSGRSRLSRLVLGTPAIYGYGDSDSVASIRTSNLIWNGAQTPAAGASPAAPAVARARWTSAANAWSSATVPSASPAPSTVTSAWRWASPRSTWRPASGSPPTTRVASRSIRARASIGLVAATHTAAAIST